jgi:hypothetical protein
MYKKLLIGLLVLGTTGIGAFYGEPKDRLKELYGEAFNRYAEGLAKTNARLLKGCQLKDWKPVDPKACKEGEKMFKTLIKAYNNKPLSDNPVDLFRRWFASDFSELKDALINGKK